MFQPLQALIAGEGEEEGARPFYVLSDTHLQKWLMSPFSPEKVNTGQVFVIIPLRKFSAYPRVCENWCAHLFCIVVCEYMRTDCFGTDEERGKFMFQIEVIECHTPQRNKQS